MSPTDAVLIVMCIVICIFVIWAIAKLIRSDDDEPVILPFPAEWVPPRGGSGAAPPRCRADAGHSQPRPTCRQCGRTDCPNPTIPGDS